MWGGKRKPGPAKGDAAREPHSGEKPRVAVSFSDLHATRARRRRRITWLLTGVLSALGAIGVLYVVLRTPIFRARAIEILGNEEVSEEAILALTRAAVLEGGWWRRVLGFKHFFVWPERIREEDLAFIPRLKELVVEKDLLHRVITVRVTERAVAGIWCFRKAEPAECFAFDESGVGFSRSLAAEGNLIRTVDDYSEDPAALGETVLPERFVPHLVSILRVLAESALSVKEVRVEDLGLEELTVTTYEGPAIYFSLRFSADAALPVLASLRSGSGGVNFKKLEYVDFRVENRVYYK